MSRLRERNLGKVLASPVEKQTPPEDMLERPRCMQEGLPVLKADIQLPPQRRGRKPKADQPASRPSAASCGFSTDGLTEKEIQERLRHSKKATGSTRTDPDEIEPEAVEAEPKRRSTKRQAHEPKAVEPAPKRKSKKLQIEEEPGDVELEPEGKSKKRQAQEPDEVEPEPKRKSKKPGPGA